MKTITTALPESVIKLLDDYKEKTGISKSRIIQNAIKDYVKKGEKHGN